MKKFLRFFCLKFLFIYCLASCQPLPESWNWGMKARPISGVRNFPPANSDYGQGFRDGCSTAWSTVGKGLSTNVEPIYNFKRLRKSSDYGVGWYEGMEQCTYIVDWDVP